MERKVIIFIMLILSGMMHAQHNSVNHIWDGRLVNHPTTNMPFEGQNQIFVIHYFDAIGENGFKDMFGVYGSANIQMGLEHGFSDVFSAYFLTEKQNKTQELGIRYLLSEQNKELDNPVGLAASFSVSIDGRDEKYFGENYYFINRFLYTSQLSVTHIFNHRWEMMANATIAHFNIVPEGNFSTFLAVNPSLSFKLNRKKAVFASFDFPLGLASASEETPQQPKPLVTMGMIFKTRTHNFQLFVSNGSHINPAKEYLNNQIGYNLEQFCFGFNINVKTHKK